MDLVACYGLTILILIFCLFYRKHFEILFFNSSELDCDPVNVPANSVVEYRHSGDGNEQVYTRCKEGYALGGDAVRTCTSNHMWNGTQPFCQSRNISDETQTQVLIPDSQKKMSIQSYSALNPGRK